MCLLPGTRKKANARFFTPYHCLIEALLCVCVCSCIVCVYIFSKLHITAQSGPVILVIICHSH